MTQHAVPDEVTVCLAKWPNLIKVGDDNDWKVWVDSGYLDSSDLGAVVRGKFRSSIKARALLTLLAPRREWNPLYWPYWETGGSNYMPTFALQVDAIPADLMPFCVSLVTTFCDLLPFETSKLQDRAATDQDDLNSMLLYLLQRAPSDLQVELFNRFRFSLARQAYPYQGFIHLLRSKADERWKVEADRRVREEVRDDPLLNTRDEGLRMSALTRYQFAVGMLVKTQRLSYSRQLLVSQVEFLLSSGIREHLRRFTGDELAGFMRHLHGEELSALRHQLVRCVVLEQAVPTGSNPFLLSNQRVGEQLLEEFGQSDTELRKQLSALIKQVKRIAKENNRRSQQSKEAEEAVLARLR